MGVTYYDETEYTVGTRIPRWTEFKFHLGVFIMRPASLETFVQIQACGLETLYFNDNRISISIRVDNNGYISAGGSDNYRKYSGMHSIYMWN